MIVKDELYFMTLEYIMKSSQFDIVIGLSIIVVCTIGILVSKAILNKEDTDFEIFGILIMAASIILMIIGIIAVIQGFYNYIFAEYVAIGEVNNIRLFSK